MMKQEFEKLAGYEVSASDYYDIIEPMYMAVNLTKQEFVKVVDKKRFALKPINKIRKEMVSVAQELKETCDHYLDFENKDKLDALCREYIERKGWSGLAGFMLTDAMTMFKCYYPAMVTIYSYKDYRTLETIDLR